MRGLRARAFAAVFRALGAGLAIAVMEALARAAAEPLSRVPFVTSIVLVFAIPEAPAARPRAVIGGHLLSTVAGLVCLTLLGQGEASSVVAVGTATLLMLVTRTLHPPAGLDAFLVVTQALPARWLAEPILLGTLALVIFARGWALLEAWLVGEAGGDRPG